MFKERRKTKKDGKNDRQIGERIWRKKDKRKRYSVLLISYN